MVYWSAYQNKNNFNEKDWKNKKLESEEAKKEDEEESLLTEGRGEERRRVENLRVQQIKRQIWQWQSLSPIPGTCHADNDESAHALELPPQRAKHESAAHAPCARPSWHSILSLRGALGPKWANREGKHGPQYLEKFFFFQQGVSCHFKEDID
jgi:hypothetical protein